MTRDQRRFKDKLIAFLKRIFWRPVKFYLLLLLGAFFPLMLLYQTVSMDVLARDTRELEEQRSKLKNEVDLLQVEIDQLSNVSRIEKLAREKYGLIGSGEEIEKIVINEYELPEAQLAEEQRIQKEKTVTHAGVN